MSLKDATDSAQNELYSGNISSNFSSDTNESKNISSTIESVNNNSHKSQSSESTSNNIDEAVTINKSVEIIPEQKLVQNKTTFELGVLPVKMTNVNNQLGNITIENNIVKENFSGKDCTISFETTKSLEEQCDHTDKAEERLAKKNFQSSTTHLDIHNKSDGRINKVAEKVDIYQLKWVKFGGRNVPIVTQNENGPCPLLAISNCLTLKQLLKLQPGTDFITAEQLMQHVCECLLESTPKNLDVGMRLNYEHNVEAAMSVLPNMVRGIDVNVRFTGVDQFEYTQECIVFDLLNIRLYHGWLVDPENCQELSAVSNYTYNQLVEQIINKKSAQNEAAVLEAAVAEEFLNRTASQLTYHGLCELVKELKDGQLCVFFRNNHFVTLYKRQGELFQLVTDQGYLKESGIVWETLSNVEGDGIFVNADFQTYTKPASISIPSSINKEITSDKQIDTDFQLALSLQHDQEETTSNRWSSANSQHISDFELARQLQEEEDRRRHGSRQQNSPRNQYAVSNDSRQSHDHTEQEKKNSNCQIL